MRDVLVRLAYSHPPCTCETWDNAAHGELCILQVVRDAEIEILRLRNVRSESDRPDSGGNNTPL